MGASFSQNAVKQTLDNFTNITTTAAAESVMSPTQVQSITCTAGRDVNIENINLDQTQVVNMTQALNTVNDGNAQTSSSAQMKQLAQALTKGINFANVSVASNVADQVLTNSINITRSLKGNCEAAFSQFQSINGDALGRDCNIKNIWLNQSQSLMSNCAASMKTNDTTIQSAQAVADQTAIAKTEGLDIMGWLMLGLIIILVLPIVLLGVKGKSGGGGGGGGGAAKAGNTILGFLGGGLLLSGIIMACVGDKETVTLYGYVNSADICGTADGPPVTNVLDVTAASNKCLDMNNDNPGSCQGFYYDGNDKKMQFYKDIKQPCRTLNNLMDNPDAPAGKRWAGIVETPHKIRNIGLGLIGGGALCIIILVVFMFVKKKEVAAASVPTL